jgi:hypothetical protein
MKQYLTQRWQYLAITAVLVTIGVFMGIPPDTNAAAVGISLGFALVVDAIKSSIITNADATPAVINSAQLANGRVRAMRGLCTLTTAAAEAASTMRFFRVKSNDMIKELVLDAGSLGTGCTMDIGLYRTAADGGAVVDADLFASAVAMATVQRATDVTTESGEMTLAEMVMPLWQVLGLTADPQIEYDVVGTLAVAATVAGTVVLTGEVIGRT